MERAPGPWGLRTEGTEHGPCRPWAPGALTCRSRGYGRTPRAGGGRGPTARVGSPRPGPAPPPSPPPARPSPAAASAAPLHSARLGVPAAAPGPQLASGGGTLPAPLRDEHGGSPGRPARGVSARRGRPGGRGSGWAREVGASDRPPPRHPPRGPHCGFQPASDGAGPPPRPPPSCGCQSGGGGSGNSREESGGAGDPGSSLPSGSQLSHESVVTGHYYIQSRLPSLVAFAPVGGLFLSLPLQTRKLRHSSK